MTRVLAALFLTIAAIMFVVIWLYESLMNALRRPLGTHGSRDTQPPVPPSKYLH